MSTSFQNQTLRRRAALLGATILTSTGAIGARAAQLPVVVQQASDPMLSGLQIPASAPTQGMWSGVQPWPINAVSLVLMPNGKIASYGTPVNNPSVQNGMTYDIWDPTQGFTGATSHTQYNSGPFVNSFCSAQAFQADGSLMISGGIFDSGVDKGTAVINSTANGVTQLTAKLADDRYYATMITRPDGTQLIMGGSYPYLGGAADPQGSIDKGYMTGMTPETYSPLTGWTSLFGATSRDAFGPDNQRWWYPRAWVAPNGKIFGISADNMWYLDPTGAGSTVAMPFKPPQAAATVATAAPNVGPVSTAVMYDVGKILQVGGNSYDNFWGFLSSSVATTVNINGASPVVADTAPMSFGRAWANSTVLPTGKVFVNGGSLYDNNAGAQAVLAAETWDPATGQWTVGPSQALYRGYHSTAALMLDGTVMSAGGGAPGPVNNQNVEIYYPPYMFTTLNGQAALAPRPQIVSLSTSSLLYAQSMQVEVLSATSLSQVVLIGLSQVTHSFNTGQRRIPLSFSQSGTIVTAQTPASAALAPPGYYQVLVIDAKGVPSTGAVVAIGSSVAAPVVEATPTGVISADVSGMTQCSAEYATCNFKGNQNVLFGANGAYISLNATGSIACNVGTFGLDPIFGTVKACYIPASSAVSGSTMASSSGGTTAPGAGGSTTSGSSSTTTVSSGSVNSTAGMVQCAVEGTTCNVTGTQTVLYGANGAYISKAVSNGVACNSVSFGQDPTPGVVKACYVASSGTASVSANSTTGLVQCAIEGTTCNIVGTQTVLYGASGTYVSKTVSNAVACNSGSFGRDPTPGVVKACFAASGSANSTAGMVQCAVEGTTCNVMGTQTVLFGANGAYISKSVSNGVGCNSGSFGQDPTPGVVKACYVASGGTASGSASATAGMVQCAVEGTTCNITGTQTVLFGANGTYISKTVTNGVFCNAGSFGQDPVPGVVKACYVSAASASAGMVRCAVEGATCNFSGTQNVLFGANGVYISKTATNGLICNAGPFGQDPVPGIVKACYLSASAH